MNNNRNPYDVLLDTIEMFSFMLTMENYQNIVDQTYLQNVLNDAIEDIHKHLEKQDKKLDMIIDLLNKEV